MLFKGLHSIHRSKVQWERVPELRSYNLKSTVSFCLEPGARNIQQALIRDFNWWCKEQFTCWSRLKAWSAEIPKLWRVGLTEDERELKLSFTFRTTCEDKSKSTFFSLTLIKVPKNLTREPLSWTEFRKWLHLLTEHNLKEREEMYCLTLLLIKFT